MMAHEGIRDWLSSYAGSFGFSAQEDRDNISLKLEHSLHVAGDMALIARMEGLAAQETALAEAVGLLHDAGRFPQYAKYRTFSDARSTNHGNLGAGVISSSGVLAEFPERERNALLLAVRHHNAYGMARLKDPLATLMLRLIRDADKLDIWRVFSEYYEARPENRSRLVAQGLSDTPGYNHAILEALERGSPGRLADATVLNDFRLLNLSWANDLNFRSTYRLLLDRGYISRIASTLPAEKEIAGAVRALEERVRARASGGQPMPPVKQ